MYKAVDCLYGLSAYIISPLHWFRNDIHLHSVTALKYSLSSILHDEPWQMSNYTCHASVHHFCFRAKMASSARPHDGYFPMTHEPEMTIRVFSSLKHSPLSRIVASSNLCVVVVTHFGEFGHVLCRCAVVAG